MQSHHANGTRWLEEAGVRPTRQRVTLASLLVGDGQHRHVTAESLFEAAKAQGDSCFTCDCLQHAAGVL